MKKKIRNIIILVIALYVFVCIITNLSYRFLLETVVVEGDIIYENTTYIISSDEENINFYLIEDFYIDLFGYSSIPKIKSSVSYNLKDPLQSTHFKRQISIINDGKILDGYVTDIDIRKNEYGYIDYDLLFIGICKNDFIVDGCEKINIDDDRYVFITEKCEKVKDSNDNYVFETEKWDTMFLGLTTAWDLD